MIWIDVVAFDFEILDQDLEHGGGHGLVYFEADDVGETPLPDAFLDRLQQVSGFEFLNRGFGVAGDVEGMRFEDFHAGEQELQVGRDELFQPDETLADGRLCRRSFLRRGA